MLDIEGSGTDTDAACEIISADRGVWHVTILLTLKAECGIIFRCRDARHHLHTFTIQYFV